MDLTALVDAAVAQEGDAPLAIFEVPVPIAGDFRERNYRLTDLRAVCRKYGTPVFEAQGVQGDIRGFKVTIDRRRAAADPYVAVHIIARDDAPGLARALQTAVEYVDEIVIGVDGRSDEATRQVAEAYADTWASFGPEEVGLTPGQWASDEIHFANARNHTRAMIKAPWTMVIDADELIACGVDLGRFLRHVDAVEGDAIGGILVPVGDRDHTSSDAQRIARTKFRYSSGMHNQLQIEGEFGKLPDGALRILHEGSLRPAEYVELRKRQREMGAERLAAEGKKGNMSALFHAAKHFLGLDDGGAEERGVMLVEDFRLRVEPHDPGHADERVYLAIYTGLHYFNVDDFRRAEMWAVRALLDGPNVEAFVLLGQIAAEENDLYRARLWYECACACEPTSNQFAIHQLIDIRFHERDRIRALLMPKANERVVEE